MHKRITKPLSILLSAILIMGLFSAVPAISYAVDKVDTLTADGLALKTSYSEFSGKTFNSDAVYTPYPPDSFRGHK